ncbi:MAG: ATP synthase F0 subunit B [Ruminococcaceae bacterium]|nr:ATP synthase F0 subunit B [Oscillospiraceae bacterium]
MMGKKFRRRLFGYKKSDVYDYIRAVDADFVEEIKEKDAEIAKLTAENSALCEKYDELQSKREIIVSVLEKAHIEADEIVSEARNEAKEMRDGAVKEIAEMKINANAEVENMKIEANREIELKRRALRNMYESETKKIEHLRDEVTELRRNSLDAIQMFERELSDIEVKLGYKENGARESVSELRRGSKIEPFADVKVPIKVIKRKTDAS